MTCFEWVCTWSVCVGGAGVGAALGVLWDLAKVRGWL